LFGQSVHMTIFISNPDIIIPVNTEAGFTGMIISGLLMKMVI